MRILNILVDQRLLKQLRLSYEKEKFHYWLSQTPLSPSLRPRTKPPSPIRLPTLSPIHMK
ncbi:hypothetical protein L873DRAFT_308008 [Choiromyces venosus 120613-1]|uniref:Uncharacterized protein n=1 Tax=Choiromyces venosus 120613-1 TaxID=1336337 RepID=A0A3N4IZZ3_9PEZI|nr:hypothetical protein L873DRAFT_859266 [Choiromyces venosus 120613-1]RPA91456.1 hypothetical protein L873DRAFT_308008 [Choiromyces venosus 120613-1]